MCENSPKIVSPIPNIREMFIRRILQKTYMKSIIIVPLLVVLVSACVNTQIGQKFDYTSDKNPEAFNITQINEEGVISRTDENMGCLAVGINLISYLGKNYEKCIYSEGCISEGPIAYSITGPDICGGVRATAFEKLEVNHEGSTSWYHVRLDDGEEGWLAVGFLREKICSTNEDCQKIHCTTPVGGGGCDAANQNFTSCENGLCKV